MRLQVQLVFDILAVTILEGATTMTFSQIPYHRADLAAWKAQVEDQTKRFLAAQTFEEADAIYRDAELSSVEFDTMISLASIRRDIDTRD